MEWSLLILALCLSIYWGTVIVKLFILGAVIRKDPNVIPRETAGIISRAFWLPVLIIEISQAWISLLGTQPSWLSARLVEPYFAIPAIHALGALTAVVTTALTFFSWHQMGRSWRIGIDPSEQTELVFDGPFRFVRHPIYTLQILLAIGVFLVMPNTFILLTVLVHISLLYWEVYREEIYLVGTHGSAYMDYQQRVGKFFPIKCPFTQK